MAVIVPVNTAAGAPLLATSDVSPTFRYRTNVSNVVRPDFRTVAAILTGTWVGTVTLQYSVPDSGVWADCPDGAFTANTHKSIELPGSCDYRWIFTSRTSGTVNAWLIP